MVEFSTFRPLTLFSLEPQKSLDFRKYYLAIMKLQDDILRKEYIELTPINTNM